MIRPKRNMSWLLVAIAAGIAYVVTKDITTAVWVFIGLGGVVMYFRNRSREPIKNTQAIPEEIKTKVYNRQHGLCANCQKSFNAVPVDYHHIVPRELGGTNNEYNIVGLCPNCHALITRSTDFNKH
jgi:hypothetical protein